MAKPALPTLLKLADQALEAVQQKLHANRLAQQVAAQHIARWQQEVAMAFSAAVAESAVQDLQAAHAYQYRAETEIKKQEAEVQALKATEAELRTELQNAYATQQRYAQLLQAQQARAKTEAARKAQANLDDLRRP